MIGAAWASCSNADVGPGSDMVDPQGLNTLSADDLSLMHFGSIDLIVD
jgi:hypothetical protein